MKKNLWHILNREIIEFKRQEDNLKIEELEFQEEGLPLDHIKEDLLKISLQKVLKCIKIELRILSN